MISPRELKKRGREGSRGVGMTGEVGVSSDGMCGLMRLVGFSFAPSSSCLTRHAGHSV